MRTFLFTTLCFVFSVTISAQQTRHAFVVDSLLKEVAFSKEDTTTAINLLTLANLYETNNQDSAEYFLQKGKALSEKLNYQAGIYYYYQQSAALSYTMGSYNKALDESQKGLVLARELKDSVKVITMLNNLGIISAYNGNLQGQLDYALMVKEAVEAIKDSTMLSGAYHNLSNCYLNLAQYRKAADAAGYAIYINKFSPVKSMYINRAVATLGQAYDALRMNDSALYYYKMAVSESKRLDDQYAEASIYGYQCGLYLSMHRFKEMQETAEKSLGMAKELQSRQLLANSLYNLASAQFYNNNSKGAAVTISQALAIAVADSLKEELKNAYTIQSYIAARNGDYTLSVISKQKADSIQEAVLNEKVVQSTADLEKKYETAKKDSEILQQRAALQRKNIYNAVVTGSAAALLLISLLGYRTYRQKQKLQQQRISELEKEQLLMATEAVLKGEEQERTRLAKDLHDGLGGMLSGIKYSLNTMKGNLIMTPENQQAFERSIDMLDSSIREMRRVAHNMMPEALVKFGLDTALRDFCSDINQSGALKVNYQSIGLVNETIEQTTAITIYRIVQELINNTIKHAKANNAIVQVSKTDGILSVTVEDDGKGFDTSLLRSVKGIGWGNIENRVEFLKGKLDVHSEAGKGTSVLIELNV